MSRVSCPVIPLAGLCSLTWVGNGFFASGGVYRGNLKPDYRDHGDSSDVDVTVQHVLQKHVLS